MLSAKGPSRVPTRFRLSYATDELELTDSKYYINIRNIISVSLLISFLFVFKLSVGENFLVLIYLMLRCDTIIRMVSQFLQF